MSDKTIVSQTEIAAFKDAIDKVASNLNAHINQALSKAHGIDLVAGFVDGGGNDRTAYRNSNGDLIGTTFVRFAVGGILYYAPGASTVLAGQPSSTGSLDSNPDITVAQSVPSPCSLITEYGSIEIQQAVNVNSLLIEHTQTNHDQVHSYGGSMQAVLKNTFDSAGYLVGRYVIKFVFGGVEYEIPCDTRVGGPPQPPKVDVIPSSKLADNIPSPYNITITPTIQGGTLPISFSWEYYNNGGWTILPVNVVTDVPFVGNVSNHVSLEFLSTATGTIQFNSGAPGGDRFDYIRLRLTATNEAGSATTDPQGNILYFDFQVQDKAPCCWFCTQGNITKRLSPEEWQTVGLIEQELFRRCRRMVVWYLRQGDVLVSRMLAAGVAQAWFEDFTTDLLACYRSKGLDKAAIFYVEQVGSMTDKFWADCAARGYKAGLDYRAKLK